MFKSNDAQLCYALSTHNCWKFIKKFMYITKILHSKLLSLFSEGPTLFFTNLLGIRGHRYFKALKR